MRKSLVLLCPLTLLFAVAVLAAPKAPDKPLEFKGAKRTVIFSHAAHARLECETCHHKLDGKENYAKCAAAGCHDNLAERNGEKSLYAVVHGKELKHQTCAECHKKVIEGQPERKKELTGCKGSKCHP